LRWEKKEIDEADRKVDRVKHLVAGVKRI
jgi:hypothetical protein